MLDRSNTVEIKYSLFKTIGFLLKWIKNNPINFVFTIFLGILLSLIFEYLSMYIANSLLLFAAPVIGSMIFVGIISYMYMKYTNKKNDFGGKSYIALFLISLLISVYNFTVLLLTEQIILLNVLQLFGLFIIILCIIDIIANKNVLGLKYGLTTFFDNIEFFIKTVLCLVVFLLVILLLSGIVFSSVPSELRIKLLLVITIVIKIIAGYITIIFITEKEKEKNIYNEKRS